MHTVYSCGLLLQMSHVAWSVCLCVCQLCRIQSAELIEMPFHGLWVKGTMYQTGVKTKGTSTRSHPQAMTSQWCGLLTNYFGHLLYMNTVVDNNGIRQPGIKAATPTRDSGVCQWRKNGRQRVTLTSWDQCSQFPPVLWQFVGKQKQHLNQKISRHLFPKLLFKISGGRNQQKTSSPRLSWKMTVKTGMMMVLVHSYLTLSGHKNYITQNQRRLAKSVACSKINWRIDTGSQFVVLRYSIHDVLFYAKHRAVTKHSQNQV